MSKLFKVDGLVYDGKTSMRREKLNVRMINDKLGKTLSIDNGNMQFIIPLEPIEKFMKMEDKGNDK